MSDFHQDPFEKELLKLRPARPAQEFLDRLAQDRPKTQKNRTPSGLQLIARWRSWIGWSLGAAMALLLVSSGFVSYRARQTPVHQAAQPVVKSAESPLRADNVEIDRQLVGSFDTVTQLPNGEPVRLQCREWLDAIVLRDSTRGVVIERQAPRFEVVPVRFETY